ncbi:hypothetical protein SCHPADRAFT_905301 [Schizopora paradoxa]|uniref:Cupredoxin n=1 Tax=Schizopora paradoxa TaxID=27342 RepID=A0A0H2RK89_9AGAM|nr:hypothetical protein SCHPADRAFT_905301 [Schizopora paradoxa]
MLALRGIVLLAVSSAVVGQVTQTVAVGTFYNPPLLAAAAVDDVIVFQFTAGTHGVTQSSVDNPCVQLAGGFNSGLIPGNTVDPPTFNLTITNITTPIWFFCQATVPFSHCANGMVGAINAPLDQYSSFTAAAKTVSGTPSPTTTLVLTGQGAFASDPPSSPTITSAPATTTSTSSTSTSSTSSSTSPAPTSSKSSSNGAAIGGGVGGAVAVLIIGILGFLLFRAKRKQPKKADPFTVPLEPGMQHFDPSKGPGNVSYVASQRTGGSEGASAGMMYQPGAGMASMAPMNSPYDQYGSNNRDSRPMMGMGMAGGYGNQNSTGNFDGPIRNREVANVGGGYAPSEPASDTNEREQREFVGPLPPNSPMGSLGGTTYRDSAVDPRTSSYTEGAGSGYKSPRRTEADVKEIAKEVAELLLPQLRANDPSRQTPPVTIPRQLPQPTDALTSGGVEPPEQPRSPGPPQYERYNL